MEENTSSEIGCDEGFIKNADVLKTSGGDTSRQIYQMTCSHLTSVDSQMITCQKGNKGKWSWEPEYFLPCISKRDKKAHANRI